MSNTRLNQYRLTNGLRAVTYRYPRMAGITIRVSIGVGPMYESSKTPAGISHLVEHLLVKRIQAAMIAANRSKEVVSECIGTTRIDQTEFVMTVHRSDLNRALAGLQALFDDSPPSESEIRLEKKVIRHEQRERRHDSEAAYQGFVRKSLYRGRAAESILGTPSSLNKIDQRHVKSFLRTWYRPQNTQLTLVGAIPATISKSLQKLGSSQVTRQSPTSRELVAPRNKAESVRIVRTNSPQLQLVYVQPLPSISERQYPAWEFLADTLDSFLFYRIRDLGLAYTQDLNLIVSPQLTGFVTESTLKLSGLVNYAKQLQTARHDFFSGLTVKRLESLKRAYGKKLELRGDSARKQAEQLSWSQYVFNVPLPLEQQAERVKQLKMADIHRLQTTLLAEPARIVCIGPIPRSKAQAAQKILSEN